jgi:pimeloyl-ACP methyl ester carboxylesterase
VLAALGLACTLGPLARAGERPGVLAGAGREAPIPEPLPTLLIPGLLCTPILYAEQLPALWGLGPVMVADHRRSETMTELAAHVLADAPPRFRLLGLSMGGYVAFEILRQAPERVAACALLDTSAQPDSPEQSAAREALIALAREQGMAAVAEQTYPRFVHPARLADRALKDRWTEMAEATGPVAFARQQRAIMSRADSRPLLPRIGCPVLMLVGDHDQFTPLPLAEEISSGAPHARLEVIPDSGHLSTLEQPKAVNAALLAAWGG